MGLLKGHVPLVHQLLTEHLHMAAVAVVTWHMCTFLQACVRCFGVAPGKALARGRGVIPPHSAHTVRSLFCGSVAMTVMTSGTLCANVNEPFL